MKTRRRPIWQQRKQTCLAFEHVSSSSPAKASYSSAIQDRLSNVKYTGARKASSIKHEEDVDKSPLPTPEPSSQLEAETSGNAVTRSNNLHKVHEEVAKGRGTTGEGEDDVVVLSSKRRKLSAGALLESGTPTRRSARQDATPSSALSPRSRSALSQSKTGKSSPLKKGLALGESETSGDDVDVPLFRGKPTHKKQARPIRDDPFVDSDDEIGEFIRTNGRSRRVERADVFVVNDDEVEYISSEEDALNPIVRRLSKARTQHKKRTKKIQDELDDDLADLKDESDEDESQEQEDADDTRRTRGGPVQTQKDRARAYLEELKRRRADERVQKIESEGDDHNFLSDFDEDGAPIADVPSSARRMMSSTRYSPEAIPSDSDEEHQSGNH
ncbi:hypothetical protein LTR66_016688, partial [Elasticomyces elasticus]